MVKNISTTVWIISFRLNKLNLSELIECCSVESAFSHINKKTCPDIRQSKNIFLLTPPRQKLQLWQRGKNGEVSGNNFSAYNVRSNDIVCISRFAGESDSPTHAERGRLMEEKLVISGMEKTFIMAYDPLLIIIIFTIPNVNIFTHILSFFARLIG